ncbi:hypothetical protein GOBAR_AA24669 [Gossypium barbadense]|uniref:Uncharacterized protein n=1 Tax=Gossypium barbadense TaxID=3634 RepID=A0A2P5WY48_GOSBA|nr:hypothetical protein GOBAR_AA24669 [Gossypium barbadense]
MLQGILTRLPVVSTDSPPKTWPHIASQPTGSSSIGSQSHKPALIQFAWFSELEDTIGLAHLHEQQLVLEKGFVRPSLGMGKPLLSTPKPHPLTQASSSLSSSTQNLATLLRGANVPFHRLSPSEATQRRAQGICYHCNEKYTCDNKCKSKPQLLLFDEDKQYSPVLESSSDSTVSENL